MQTVLVLCDDRWHSAATPRTGLAPLEHVGLTFDWVEHPADWSAARLSRAAAVILTKANNVSATDESPWMTEAIAAALTAHVRYGHGLLVIHSGLVGYQESPTLRRLMGGVFRQHPPQCLVKIAPRPGHPITAGCEAFTVWDEHYFVTLDDPSAQLIVVTMSEHGEQPGGWTRTEGAGRVCALTPGHQLAVWLHPAYQRLIANALQWCAG